MYNRRELKPKDSYNKLISEAMMQQSEFKDRLTKYCAFEYSSNDPIGTMEIALNNMLKAEPILDKINLAIKEGLLAKKLPFLEMVTLSLSNEIINSDEAQILEEFEHARIDAIMVNDFDNATLTRK
jgi:hypothetical protein